MKESAAKLNVGILGVGAIGHALAMAIDQNRVHARLVAVSDQNREKALTSMAQLRNPARVVSLEELVECSDLVVEAASQAAVENLLPMAIAHGRDVLIMSVGGLLGRDDWFRQASESGCRIHVPSGAIAGLDGIRAASLGRLDSALLVSRKPIAALKGTKYVLDHSLDLDLLREGTVLFAGSAEEAARAFPATANVAAALRLAVPSSVPVEVRVVAAPGGLRNIHEITVHGDFGRLTVAIENVPSETNPRTSRLAALSALATLNDLTEPLRLGT
jgi:aspartate dehydrogenase